MVFDPERPGRSRWADARTRELVDDPPVGPELRELPPTRRPAALLALAWIPYHPSMNRTNSRDRRSLMLPLTLAMLGALACVACGPLPATDAGETGTGSDTVAVDAVDAFDAPPSEAGDAIVGDSQVCPDPSQAPFLAGRGPCPANGLVCTYGYSRPECGGRTLTCAANVWSEMHTDPTPSCYVDGGVDAGTHACGAMTCDPSQFCIHHCSGIDIPDGPVSVPMCGTPASCPMGMGYANGYDWFCTGCV